MQFQLKIERSVGGEGKQLGSDVAPEGPPHSMPRELLLQLRPANINGFPVQRIVIGMHGPEGSSVPVAIYVHDDLSGRWFNTAPAKDSSVKSGRVAYFDLPVVAHLNSQSSDGAIELCIVPQLPKSAIPGEYLFVVGGDVSNPG